MKTKLLKTGLLASLLALMATSVGAATLTFNFDLPATGLSSINPPYPNVATLEITDIAGGVQMTLTPNWSSIGWENKNNDSVNSLEIVMPSLAGVSAAYSSGAKIKSFDLDAGANMDSSYTSNATSFKIEFEQSVKDKFDSDFNFSIWTVTGGGLSTDSFDGLSATANNKPSPIFGIISVSSYSLKDLTPTPSNWVAGSAPAVPLPAAAYLFGSALLGMVGIGYRRNKKQA